MGIIGGSSKAHTPVEAKESGRSKQNIKIVEILSEGEIEGFVNGESSIYLDNTPLKILGGEYNFKNVEVSAQEGTQYQPVLSGFNTSEKEISVGTQVRKATPLVRTITDSKVNRVRFTLGVQSLFEQNNQGDTNGTEVNFMVTVGEREIPFKIAGKYSSQYLRSFTISNLPPVPFQIRVARLTDDSKSQRLQNNTLWASYTEIIDSEFAYPNTAVVGIKFDSEYFSNIPNRTYEIYGIKVRVPSNYDPKNRTYSGLWDGTFKIAWTNNPVWILNDFLTSTRYGLGQRLGEFSVDKWTFYQAAQYCDHLVPDGFGGKEPRFVCNAWLTEQRSAYDTIHDLCSIFRAMPVWTGREFTLVMDRPSAPVWTYTNANVENGEFTYTFSAMKSRSNAIQVEYADAENNYEKAIEYVSDDQAIRKYGLNLKKVTAFGCTSRGQANRTGRWILETEKLETKTVSFVVGSEGLMHIPGDIINIADTDYAGTEIGGRVLAVNGRTVTLDREIELTPNSYFSYVNGEALLRNIKIHEVSGTQITLDSVPTGLETYGVWSLATQRVSTQLFRALSVTENEKGKYTITALQHEPQKEAIVDNGAVFEPRNTTLHSVPQINHINIGDSFNGGVNVSAEVSGGSGRIVYDLYLYKEGKLYQTYLGQKSPNLTLDNLPNGNYELVIIVRNAKGQRLSQQSKTFVIERPPAPKNVYVQGGLGNIILEWDYVDEFTQTEIFASKTNDYRTAVRVAKVLSRMYSHQVGAEQVRYYWLRHTKGINNGPFYQEQGLRGESGADIDKELALLNKRLKLNVADGAIDTAKFARGLEPVKIVETLNVNQYQQAKLVHEVSSGRLYVWNGRKYEYKTPAGAIDGKIQMEQLAAIPTTKLTGQISDQQIAQLNAAKLAGQVQLGALPAIPTTKLQGQLSDHQIAQVNAQKIAGKLRDAQIEQISAAKIAGQVQMNQIAPIPTAKLQGQVSAGQIAANAIGANHLQAGVIRATHLGAGQITADKLAVGLGGNLLLNPIFSNTAYGWFENRGNGALARQTTQIRRYVTENLLGLQPNESVLVGEITSESIPTSWWQISIQQCNVQPHQRYCFSAYIDALKCTGRVVVQELTESGRWVRDLVSSPKQGRAISGYHQTGAIEFGHAIDDSTRAHLFFTAPASGKVSVLISASDIQSPAAIIKVARPMLEECTEHTREPSPWQNAGVTAIHGGSIVTESISALQIESGAIVTDKLAANSVTTPKIVANAIAANHIQASAVVADKIAANAVNAEKITANAVRAHHVQANAIGANHIQANAVVAGKIAANAVTSATIQAGAIRADHIAAGQISTEKLAVGLGGNLLPNPILANDGYGWSDVNGDLTGFQIEREYRKNVGAPKDFGLKDGLENESLLVTKFVGTSNTLKTGQWADCKAITLRVSPGKWYIFSAYYKCYRSAGRLLVEKYSSDLRDYQGVIAETPLIGELGGDKRGSFQHGLKDAPRHFVKFQAPETGAVSLRVRVTHFQGNNPDAYFARPMLEECHPEATQPGPWKNAGITAIHGGSIITETITAQQIGANAITANKIAAGAVYASHIAARTITGDKIMSRSISGNEIKANSLDATHIKSYSITAEHLASNSITGDKISANSVITAPTIKGGVIEGGSIYGTHIQGITVEAENIIGDVIKAYFVQYNNSNQYVSGHTMDLYIPASRRTRLAYLMPVILVSQGSYTIGAGERDKWTWSSTTDAKVVIRLNGDEVLSNKAEGSNYAAALQGVFIIPAGETASVQIIVDSDNGGLANGTQFVFFVGNA